MKRAYLFLLGSFVWLVGGMLAVNAIGGADKSGLADALILTVLIGFAGLFLTGMGLWSAAKGYHVMLGVVLGVAVGPVGLAVLTFLPDKTRERCANAAV